MNDVYINLARTAIKTFEQQQCLLIIDDSFPPQLLKRRAGVYVSLFKPDGQLRSSMGTVKPTRNNLAEEIAFAAVISAFFNPQFLPLRKKEIEELKIRVDIFVKSEVYHPNKNTDFDYKRQGVLIESLTGNRAVLLPNFCQANLSQTITMAARKAKINLHNDKHKIIIFTTEIHQE